MITEPGQHQRITATVEELSRLMGQAINAGGLEAEAADTGQLERIKSLNRELIEAGAPPEILAASAGGGFAVFDPRSRLDPDVTELAVVAATVLLDSGDGSLEVLGALSLAAMTSREWDGTSTSDLVRAAEALRRREQLGAASGALRLALARSDSLDSEYAAWAHLSAARLGDAGAHLPKARAHAAALPESATVWAAIRSVEAAVVTNADDLAGALMQGRVADAAAIYLRDLASADLNHEVPLVAGFTAFLEELASSTRSASAMREALSQIVGHVRDVQRLDEHATAARTAVDAAIELLLAGSSPESTNVLAELLEALADAGLSELAPNYLIELLASTPELTTSQLRQAAQAQVLWPDMSVVMTSLSLNPPARWL